MKSLDTPTFEDYTGSTPVPAANTAIDGIKSKTKLSALMSNIKAAFKGACLIGHIVNNCVTNNPNLPLSAAQGKVLMDLYTQLNGEMVNGKLKGYIEVGDEDDIIEILQTLFNGYGFSYITISNPSKNVPSGFSYSGGFVVHRWDTLSVILLSYSISKIAINSCTKKNNAYTWTGWKIFTGN